MLFLRYGGVFSKLRGLPLIGTALHWLSGKALRRDTLVWFQVKKGAAAGLWLKINPRTSGYFLEEGGEAAMQQAVVSHVRPGMVFYDLGANMGFYSLLAARLVGPQGLVVAFEADPEVAARLRENVAHNDLSWIRVEQKAVWSESRPVEFARVDPSVSPDRGLGHVATAREGSEVIIVSAVSLDDYCHESLPPVFIKCDFEGAEVSAYRGANRLLREKRPIILCEIHTSENKAQLVNEFSALGYRCLDSDMNHVLALPR